MRAVKKEWLLGMLCVLSGVMLMVMHPVQALSLIHISEPTRPY